MVVWGGTAEALGSQSWPGLRCERGTSHPAGAELVLVLVQGPGPQPGGMVGSEVGSELLVGDTTCWPCDDGGARDRRAGLGAAAELGATCWAKDLGPPAEGAAGWWGVERRGAPGQTGALVRGTGAGPMFSIDLSINVTSAESPVAINEHFFFFFSELYVYSLTFLSRNNGFH